MICFHDLYQGCQSTATTTTTTTNVASQKTPIKCAMDFKHEHSPVVTRLEHMANKNTLKQKVKRHKTTLMHPLLTQSVSNLLSRAL